MSSYRFQERSVPQFEWWHGCIFLGPGGKMHQVNICKWNEEDDDYPKSKRESGEKWWALFIVYSTHPHDRLCRIVWRFFTARHFSCISECSVKRHTFTVKFCVKKAAIGLHVLFLGKTRPVGPSVEKNTWKSWDHFHPKGKLAACCNFFIVFPF